MTDEAPPPPALSASERDDWRRYAAAALSGLLHYDRYGLAASFYAKRAAEIADAMLLEQRLRPPTP